MVPEAVMFVARAVPVNVGEAENTTLVVPVVPETVVLWMLATWVELWDPVMSPDKEPVNPAELPEMLPVTWDPGRDRAGRVVRVELLVAVMLAAVPVVFWFRVGTSAAAITLKVGDPELPVGAARNVLEAWLFKLANVSVPEVVTGEPDIVKSPVLSARATEVTVPAAATVVQVGMPAETVRNWPEVPIGSLAAVFADAS